MLKVEKNVTGGKATVSLEGRLDTVTAPELEAELKDVLENASSMTLDFEKLEYISSAGLRVLLAMQKILGKKNGMKVIHVNETVMEVFEVTGFSDILTIE